MPFEEEIAFINAAKQEIDSIAKIIKTCYDNFPTQKLSEISEINKDAYHETYDALIQAGKNVRDNCSEINIKILALAVYGWMPTVLDNVSYDNYKVQKALIYMSENDKIGNEDAIMHFNNLAKMLNNSYVGVSKFLHAVFPDKYAIWDRRIASVLNKKCSGITIKPKGRKKTVKIFTNDANHVEKFIIYELAVRKVVENKKNKDLTLRAVEERLFYS